MINNLPKLYKILIFTGILLIIAGIVIWFIGSKFPNVKQLPGNLFIQKKNFSFYFPITTCIVLSVILSLIVYLISRFLK